jgi:hypothetical protein
MARLQEGVHKGVGADDQLLNVKIQGPPMIKAGTRGMKSRAAPSSGGA